MDYLRRDSLKRRIRSSNCFSCCFRGRGGEPAESPTEGAQEPSLMSSSAAWVRSKANEIPELKDKCRNLVSRMGRSRRHSGDFRYDPLSYARNFDEGPDFDEEEEVSPSDLQFRSFSARLPPTPPHPTPAAAACI
ncbi:unnamed protein product [Spirodela intermedia]|uniref:Uncharacterized protein n=1 Tax=Spirodela intermedia TaxID=51605 RepID=A0A811G790_SPIIN|nr:unnamed protein product [Spirodela intermedia]